MNRLNTTSRCALGAVALLMFSPFAYAQIDVPGRLERRPEGADRIKWHISDPEFALPVIEEAAAEADRPADRKFAESLLERIRRIRRDNRVFLSLEEALHRALASSHLIRVQGYEPAISTAALVQAEAVFDAVFFSSMVKNKQNAPTPSELVGTNTDQFNLNTGIQKLLPTGGQITTTLNLSRTSTNNQFATVNPVYTSYFEAELAQPLLRGAGVDFSRSQIRISQNDLKSSRLAFKRQVRETLYQVEQAYWRLVQARREVLIQARLLSEFEKIYDYLWQRRDFDIFQIQLSQTKANLETSKSSFLRVLFQVRNAEDNLLALINDPELNLVDSIEIIPVDELDANEVDIDRVASVLTALDNRAELGEARLAVSTAGIAVGQAENQALPRLDLLFQYRTNGLGTDADEAFSEWTTHDFINYFVGLDLEMPIGNRGRRAAEREARLRYAQAIASFKAQEEQIVLDVNTAARAAQTEYDSIEPSLESADANEDQVFSVIARQERKDFTALNQELNARTSLATSRSALLEDLIQYNIALAALERAKGTLLNHNNVVIAELEGP